MICFYILARSYLKRMLIVGLVCAALLAVNTSALSMDGETSTSLSMTPLEASPKIEKKLSSNLADDQVLATTMRSFPDVQRNDLDGMDKTLPHSIGQKTIMASVLKIDGGIGIFVSMFNGVGNQAELVSEITALDPAQDSVNDFRKILEESKIPFALSSSPKVQSIKISEGNNISADEPIFRLIIQYAYQEGLIETNLSTERLFRISEMGINEIFYHVRSLESGKMCVSDVHNCPSAHYLIEEPFVGFTRTAHEGLYDFILEEKTDITRPTSAGGERVHHDIKIQHYVMQGGRYTAFPKTVEKDLSHK